MEPGCIFVIWKRNKNMAVIYSGCITDTVLRSFLRNRTCTENFVKLYVQLFMLTELKFLKKKKKNGESPY